MGADRTKFMNTISRRIQLPAGHGLCASIDTEINWPHCSKRNDAEKRSGTKACSGNNRGHSALDVR